MNVWSHELKSFAPATPVILVGCQSDLRGDRQTINHLARQGRAPVSPDQGRSFSKQAAAVSYVETSSKLSSSGPEAIFQLAAQISLDQVRSQESRSTPSNSLERSTESFWDQYQYSSPANRSASLSSSLNSTRSSLSMPTAKSPSDSRRKSFSRGKQAACPEKMMKIKCQRLNGKNIYEEIEIEVPSPVYENLQASNEISTHNINRFLKRKESFSSKLKHIFLRN